MNEDMLETLINQALDGVLETVPIHLKEVKQDMDKLKVENPKEFVYGLIVGMILAMGSALASVQSGNMPTPEEQMKVRNIVYKRIPQIREKIFKL